MRLFHGQTTCPRLSAQASQHNSTRQMAHWRGLITHAMFAQRFLFLYPSGPEAAQQLLLLQVARQGPADAGTLDRQIHTVLPTLVDPLLSTRQISRDTAQIIPSKKSHRSLRHKTQTHQVSVRVFSQTVDRLYPLRR